ncbi:MAG: bifunctional glutamate N-acetyltransferase/amino-acid acetyltransferase ArgJ [Deltaproteobacteria bacterium]|uniref:Arginine biosynthesis bifunctional protein ArgJ n=1 Tax=Candidatus Zymogenus saltonus TaxID=2844893 RepID=A0A9D8KCN8_9DELT|nr:bifunctional glutamate N-acetyltransferase/amino-acid acetyltransferase ArgJ [Candidatus Zymogenus saltonus]
MNPYDFTCPGFRAAGVASGIKGDGALDLGLIVSDSPTNAAAVFTKNRVKAAPLTVAAERVRGNSIRAVLANSGNANACTGDGGVSDAENTTWVVASLLKLPPEGVIPASTGVIGQRLPAENINSAARGLVSSLKPEGFVEFAEAIMTTDTFSKISKRIFSAGGCDYTILGIAKGAGMIRPDMATMLSFIVTDAPIRKDALSKALKGAVEVSFNAITVDGDTSTNDMVILMARDDAAFKGDVDTLAAIEDKFRENLGSLLVELAEMIVKDGEGATKMVSIKVLGAPNKRTARDVAFRVANSPLVKTAFFGEDPNWGRIMGAVGCVEGDFDPMGADIYFNDLKLVSGGVGNGIESERAAARIMKNRRFDVTIDLKGGKSTFTVLTTDFSFDYVKINAEYRS